MHVVKGFINDDRFTPADGIALLNHAYAVLVAQEAFINDVDKSNGYAV